MNIPLSNVDPWAEIAVMLAEANPTLDVSKVNPFRMAAGTGRNTRLFLVGNSAIGLAGKLYIEYDRLDPSKVFSKFGDLTKHRPVRLYGVPGTVVKVSDVLRQINDLLNINLTMTGNYRDIIDSNFTLPAKGNTIVIDIQPYVSASGEMPINLRLMPATKLSLNLINGGVAIKDLSRNLNPFVKTDGNINWTLSDRTLTDTTPSRDMALYNLDFSDLFGTKALINSCYKSTNVLLPGYYQRGYTFTDDVVNRINAKLDTVGLAPLIKDRAHFVYAYDVGNMDIVGDHSIGQGRSWAYTANYMVNNASGSVGIRATPPNINKTFSRVFKVFPPAWPQGTSYNDDLVAHDKLPAAQRMMHLHFNAL